MVISIDIYPIWGILHMSAKHNEENEMRKQFIQTNSRKKAINLAPWASYLHKAADGYWAFESYDDYKTHINQK